MPPRHDWWHPWLVMLLSLVLMLALPLAVAAQTSSISIAWDPIPDADVAGYVVHVGTASGESAQQFDVGNRTSFDFVSGDTGRRYFFAVTAYNTQALMSERSDEVSAVVGAPASDGHMTGIYAVPRPGVEVPPAGNGTGFSRAPHAIRSELAAVGALASAGDEGVLMIEGRRVIRALANGMLRPEPLLVAPPGFELTGLAVDPSFEQTHTVFVGEVETLTDGRRELTIARYRVVAHTFGERAVIVGGIELPGEGDAVFDVDTAGHLFVAVPAEPLGQSRSGDVYGGMVLRFNVDGTVPRDNRAASPVVAYGYRQPTALKIDQTGRAWLAGRSASWPQPLAVLDLNAESARWPATPLGVGVTLPAATDTISALDVIRTPTAPDVARLTVLAGEGLTVLKLSRDGLSSPRSWSLAGHGTPTALLQTGATSVLVAFTSDRGDLRISDAAAVAQFQVP